VADCPGCRRNERDIWSVAINAQGLSDSDLIPFSNFEVKQHPRIVPAKNGDGFYWWHRNRAFDAAAFGPQTFPKGKMHGVSFWRIRLGRLQRVSRRKRRRLSNV
jgi:hypothetical protein